MFNRYVADRLANEEQNQQQPQLQQSSSSEDVDMESIGRSDSISSHGVFNDDASFDELSAKFSKQGTSNSKSSGKKKVVSKFSRIKRSLKNFFFFENIFLNVLYNHQFLDSRKLWVFKSFG